ncbi:Hypothetical predicted protein, partial [Mytilus galloprovincialis]
MGKIISILNTPREQLTTLRYYTLAYKNKSRKTPSSEDMAEEIMELNHLELRIFTASFTKHNRLMQMVQDIDAEFQSTNQ